MMRWIPRIVAGALLLMLPFSLAFAYLVAEPYPALFQPRFAGSPEKNGVTSFERIEVLVETPEGVTEITLDDLLPQGTPVLKDSIVKTLLASLNSDAPDESMTWLKKRLNELPYGQNLNRVTFTTISTSYSVQTAEILEERRGEKIEVVLR